MALSEVLTGAIGRTDAAPAGEFADSDFDHVLSREQYLSLARIAPYHCGVAIVATAVVGYFAGRTSPPLGAIVLVGALALVLYRLAHWLEVRPCIERQSLDVVRRDLRQADVEIPTLTFVFCLLAVMAFRRVGPVEESLLLVASWIVAAACALCLMRLARCAVLVVAASTAPIAAAFVLSGHQYSLWLAALIVIASGLIGYMLIENSRAFSELVRSRFTIADMHRAAEEGRQAATAIANSDHLTGLPNRRFLLSLLADRTQAGQRSAKPFAVGLVDLDGFKPINDIHGHQAGDAILKQVGDRLAAAMRGRGHAARMGGDEFAIVCDGVEGRNDAVALGREIREVFAAPFHVEKLAIHVGCTSGFALFPGSADQPDRLIRLADIALYRAKTRRRGDIGVFDVGDENAAVARAKLEQALYRAVACASIGVCFQPIVELATGRITGFESLARWRDCELGPIAPAVFIPLAEQLGLMEKLSFDLLEKSVSAAAQWPGDLSLSFNLSAELLLRPNAGPDILVILEESRFSASRLEVEVTETAIVRNFDAASATIDALQAAGVRVALDDFGAGRSSLAQLRDLALDKIKIDKSFVDRVCLDPKIASLTRSIVDIARRLDLPCVAEGIERPEQLEELRLAGCEGGQGRLFAEAMPEAMAARYIAERREAPHYAKDPLADSRGRLPNAAGGLTGAPTS